MSNKFFIYYSRGGKGMAEELFEGQNDQVFQEMLMSGFYFQAYS